MNWALFWQLFITVILAFTSAWTAHVFTTARDRKNKRTDQRITYLIEAYRRLESVSNRPSTPNEMRLVESAVADIQLFGTSSQILLVQKFISEFVAAKNASLDDVLKELRKDLRAELQLESVSDELRFLRWSREFDSEKTSDLPR